MVVFSKFLPMYLLIIHCTGTVMLLGDGEVNKLPNDGGRKMTKFCRDQNLCQLQCWNIHNTNTTKYYKHRQWSD